MILFRKNNLNDIQYKPTNGSEMAFGIVPYNVHRNTGAVDPIERSN